MKATTKTVLMDADGVFVDFVGGVLNLVQEITQQVVKPAALTGWEIMDDLETLTGHEGLKDELYRRIEQPEFCANLRPCPGAEPALLHLIRLCNAGKIEFLIATSPWDSSPTWMYERTRWFTRRGLHRHRILHAAVKHPIRADLFVDDKPSHVESWRAAHPDGHAFLWTTPHNMLEAANKRLMHWDDFFMVLQQITKEDMGWPTL